MQKIWEIFLNIILLPRSFYERLSDRKITLVLGILAVGTMDLLLPDFIRSYEMLYTGMAQESIVYNFGITLPIILVIGVVDTVFFSLPIFDFSRFLKKREEIAKESANIEVTNNDFIDGRFKNRIAADKDRISQDNPYGAGAIKAIKVYITSNLLLAPVAVLMHYAFFRDIGNESPDALLNTYMIYFYTILIWMSAVITRGLNTIFNFSAVFKRIAGLVVFIWTFILGIVFETKIMDWVMHLFRSVPQ